MGSLLDNGYLAGPRLPPLGHSRQKKDRVLCGATPELMRF
jgi:hypothetical protein